MQTYQRRVTELYKYTEIKSRGFNSSLLDQNEAQEWTLLSIVIKDLNEKLSHQSLKNKKVTKTLLKKVIDKHVYDVYDKAYEKLQKKQDVERIPV